VATFSPSTERSADEARRHDPQIPFAFAAGSAQDQRCKSEQPALATVVGPHDDEHVFNRDHQHESPDDQRERAQYGSLAEVTEIDQRLPDGVERGSADIAEYDAQGSECQARAGIQAKDMLLRRRL
jgi:hypothetical protein